MFLAIFMRPLQGNVTKLYVFGIRGDLPFDKKLKAKRQTPPQRQVHLRQG